MRTEDLRLFAAIVDAGSMTQAGERLGLAKSVISRRLSDLEDELGATLFVRTTRQLRLTAEGEAFFARVVPILRELERATDAVADARGALAGLIRVAAPVSFGQMQLADALLAFAQAHPAIDMRVELSDHSVDLVSAGVDVAIRVGRLTDSSLVARRLGTSRRAVVMSPLLAARHGVPRTLEALQALPSVAYTNRHAGGEWLFATAAGPRAVHLPVRFAADTGALALRAAVAGLGVAVTPTFLASAPVARGELIAVALEGAELVADDITALRPLQGQTPRRVRALIDHLLDRFREPPPWDAPFVQAAAATPVAESGTVRLPT